MLGMMHLKKGGNKVERKFTYETAIYQKKDADFEDRLKQLIPEAILQDDANSSVLSSVGPPSLSRGMPGWPESLGHPSWFLGGPGGYIARCPQNL